MKSVIVFDGIGFHESFAEKLRQHVGAKYVLVNIEVNELSDEALKLVSKNYLILTQQIPKNCLLRKFDIWALDRVPKWKP